MRKTEFGNSWKDVHPGRLSSEVVQHACRSRLHDFDKAYYCDKGVWFWYLSKGMFTASTAASRRKAHRTWLLDYDLCHGVTKMAAVRRDRNRAETGR